MAWVLRGVFVAILLVMLTVTVVASMDRGVLVALDELWPDPWFRATLVDAYAGFITIYIWIAYRERTLFRRILWAALLLALGNIAIAAYILRALTKLRPGESVERLLARPGSQSAS